MILDIRSDIALARVIATFDKRTARQHAATVLTMFTGAIFYANQLPDETAVSRLQYDPLLRECYARTLALRTQHRQQLKLYQEQMADLKAKQFSMHKKELQRRSELDAQTPDAVQMCKMLCSGQLLNLCQHTLSVDADGLSGTNPYGVDYYFNRLSLINVSVWREAVIKGEIWGRTPPGCEADPADMSIADESALVQSKKITSDIELSIQTLDFLEDLFDEVIT